MTAFVLMGFYASALLTAVDRGILFSDSPSLYQSVCPILVNPISQEQLQGIYSNLAHMSTWTQGSNEQILVVKGQSYLASHLPQSHEHNISEIPKGNFISTNVHLD